MKLEDFDYHLPEELIAQVPLENRAASRLMVLDKETTTLNEQVERFELLKAQSVTERDQLQNHLDDAKAQKAVKAEQVLQLQMQLDELTHKLVANEESLRAQEKEREWLLTGEQGEGPSEEVLSQTRQVSAPQLSLTLQLRQKVLFSRVFSVSSKYSWTLS